MLMEMPRIDPEASTKPEDAAKWGLGQAQQAHTQSAGRQYDFPDWYGSGRQAPQMQQYRGGAYQKPADTALGDMNRMELPQYSGLMGQDYNRLESSLRDPAMQQIGERFRRGGAAGDARMGGAGLYGSSIDEDMLKERTRAQGMAESDAINRATAQRYGFEAEDLGRMNQFNLAGTGLGMQQEQNVFSGNLREAQRKDAQIAQQNQFNLGRAGINQAGAAGQFESQMAGMGWDEQQRAGEANWGLMGNQFQQGLDDTAYNRMMSMATGSMPTYNAQIDADANMWGGLMQGGGNLLGGWASGGFQNPFKR